ncbi:histidine kinase [Pontiellaceae bacterium B12219]|nr:histidine kinase [Pontiellaceae bacterium B12219]
MKKNKNRSRLLPFIAVLLPAALCAATEPAPSAGLQNQSLAWLKHRLTEIDGELTTLADYSLRSGTGAIGYRSIVHESEYDSEWIQIDFGAEYPLDEVILVPVIRRDAKTGFQADGFPKAFRLIAGTDGDQEGTVLSEYSEAAHILPRTAPFFIPCDGFSASWIRIEADQLSLRAFDEQYVFQLSEILALSGHENVALHQSVSARSNRRDGLAWDTRFLVDGSVPYLMDAASEAGSVAFISRFTTNISPSLTVDLGKPHPVSRLHLHAVDPSDVLPQSLPSDFAIPHKMLLEAASQADFLDAETVINLHLQSIYDMAPIMMWTFPETTNRFFRLSINAPAEDPLYGPEAPRFGFAEIELYSGGVNVALGKTITGIDVTENPNRPISLLTDGRNMYGSILSIRDWMKQLARRHDLETERPLVARALNLCYDRQKAILQRMGWLSALLATGIILTVLIERIFRMRKIRQIEQRIAADLHDELGANLHTIGLLSDLAEDCKDDPDELATFHQRIRAVTERSGIAVRTCTDMLNSEDLYKGLVADMQRAAQRSLAKLDHKLSIEGEEYLDQLNRRNCVDLFLFYKESLVNISRHSGATRFSTELKVRPRELQLTISDNGRGLAEPSGNGIPKSLKRRARLLGAKVTVETPPTGGTSIHLKLRIRKHRHINRGLK